MPNLDYTGLMASGVNTGQIVVTLNPTGSIGTSYTGLSWDSSNKVLFSNKIVTSSGNSTTPAVQLKGTSGPAGFYLDTSGYKPLVIKNSDGSSSWDVSFSMFPTGNMYLYGSRIATSEGPNMSFCKAGTNINKDANVFYNASFGYFSWKPKVDGVYGTSVAKFGAEGIGESSKGYTGVQSTIIYFDVRGITGSGYDHPSFPRRMMVISPTGIAIGINHTGPTQALDVKGNIKCTGFLHAIQGITGPGGSGTQGVTGVGIQGVTGVGVQGTTGVDGLQGITGLSIQGVTGVGIQGVTGIQGIQGETGVGTSGGNSGSATIANNQSVTDLDAVNLDFTSKRGAVIHYTAYRKTDSNEVGEIGTIRVVYKDVADTWAIDNTWTGDDSGVTFTMETTNDRLQYASTNIAGTNYSGVMKWSLTTFDA